MINDVTEEWRGRDIGNSSRQRKESRFEGRKNMVVLRNLEVGEAVRACVPSRFSDV